MWSLDASFCHRCSFSVWREQTPTNFTLWASLVILPIIEVPPSLIHGPGDSHCHWGRWDYTLKHTLTWVTYTEWDVRRREDDHPDPRHLIGRYQDLDQSDAYDPGRCGSESPVIKVNYLGLKSKLLQPKIILMHRLYSLPPIVVNKNNEGLHPLVTRRCSTLNQRHWRWFNVATKACAQWVDYQ